MLREDAASFTSDRSQHHPAWVVTFNLIDTKYQRIVGLSASPGRALNIDNRANNIVTDIVSQMVIKLEANMNIQQSSLWLVISQRKQVLRNVLVVCGTVVKTKFLPSEEYSL